MHGAPVDKNSMLYWWNIVKELPVPKPRTIIIPLNERDVDMFFKCYYEAVDGIRSRECIEFGKRVREIFDEVKKAVTELGGYPVFLRTDYTSGKHYSLRKPLYRIESAKDLGNIWILICECHEPTNVGYFAPPPSRMRWLSGNG